MQWQYRTKLAGVDYLTTLPPLGTHPRLRSVSTWILTPHPSTIFQRFSDVCAVTCTVTWVGGRQDGTHGEQLHPELLQVVISARLSRIYQWQLADCLTACDVAAHLLHVLQTIQSQLLSSTTSLHPPEETDWKSGDITCQPLPWHSIAITHNLGAFVCRDMETY